METDTPGGEEFRRAITVYMKGAHAVIVGFDVTRPETLHECDSWLEDFARNKEQFVVVAVGNKIDLVDERKVSTEEARAHFAGMDPPVRYFETSAKMGDGVQELFEAVARMAIDMFSLLEQNENTSEDTGQEGTTGTCTVC